MLREASIGLAGALLVAYAVEFLFSSFHDSREPRRIAPKVPVIGHMLGYLRYGWGYYNRISQNSDAEIYTIAILNFKVYVTHSIRLTSMIHKSKTFSPTPITQADVKVHSAITDESSALFDAGLIDRFRFCTKESLAPGPQLDVLNLRMKDQLLHEVTQIQEQGEIQLLGWIKHAILHITGIGLYGINHPFTDPEIENAIWIWDEHKTGHIMGIDPLRKGYKARTKVFEAYGKYFRNMPDDVSPMIRERYRILSEGGICKEDIYRIQSNLSDANSNTIPTLFWTVYEIFSRPDLLEEIRQEVLSKAVQKSSDGGFVLDVTALKTECHLLLSAYQETQRIWHSQVTWRYVGEDTLLDGHLLKKGSYIHLPSRPVHEDPQIWGPRATAFDPYRFMPAAGETKAKISPRTFLPWGAPPYICPGRQFISVHIMVMMALLTLRVDLAPASGKQWERQPALNSMEMGTLPSPKKDVSLKVTTRKEGAVPWTILMGESKTRVSLASG